MYVYPQFTETIALIKEYGFDMLENPTSEDVELIRLTKEKTTSSYNNLPMADSELDDETKEYTDKEQIQQILDNIINERFYWYPNYGDLFDHCYFIEIRYAKNDRNNSDSNYLFITGQIPAFIQ